MAPKKNISLSFLLFLLISLQSVYGQSVQQSGAPAAPSDQAPPPTSVAQPPAPSSVTQPPAPPSTQAPPAPPVSSVPVSSSNVPVSSSSAPPSSEPPKSERPTSTKTKDPNVEITKVIFMTPEATFWHTNSLSSELITLFTFPTTEIGAPTATSTYEVNGANLTQVYYDVPAGITLVPKGTDLWAPTGATLNLPFVVGVALAVSIPVLLLMTVVCASLINKKRRADIRRGEIDYYNKNATSVDSSVYGGGPGGVELSHLQRGPERYNAGARAV